MFFAKCPPLDAIVTLVGISEEIKKSLELQIGGTTLRKNTILARGLLEKIPHPRALPGAAQGPRGRRNLEFDIRV